MKRVPIFDVTMKHAALKSEMLESIGRVIDHGDHIFGEEVKQFEHKFAELCGVLYAVGVNSGSDAIAFTLRALGIGPGDEVVTSANSFIASAGAAIALGARPVLVDVGDDLNINPDCLEAAITPRSKVIIAIHEAGRPARMDAVMDIAAAHSLHVIEDGTQAVGAEFRSKRVGSFGVTGCFSLPPHMTLGALGDAGILTTNDPDLYKMVQTFRSHGLERRDNAIVWSGNSRLDTLQAAVLLAQFQHVDEWVERRRAHAQTYLRMLADLPEILLPLELPVERNVYEEFRLLTTDNDRDALRNHLTRSGIESLVYHPVPPYLQPHAAAYGFIAGAFPVAESQTRRNLSIPVSHTLTTNDVEYVASTIRGFYQESNVG